MLSSRERLLASFHEPHDTLEAFKTSYAFGLAILESTENWPKREMYGLSSQIRRASTSISVNIAEGVAKRGGKDLRRYLDIALGSLAESDVLLRFAGDRNFITKEEWNRLEGARARAGRLTWGLYEAIVSGRGRPLEAGRQIGKGEG
jgi:four helix bundle protein